MIHPSAVIDPAACIGADVVIGPFVVVEGPVVVGDGCRIGAQAHLSGDTVLGAGCTIHPFCAIGGLPQDFSYKAGTSSGVTIGAGCEFREGATVHRSTRAGGRTLVGDHVYVMTGGHIAHDCVIGDRVVMANCTHLGGFTEVEAGAVLSGNISVHQKVRIGGCSMTAASSYLNQDLPPFCMAVGVPAAVVGLNTVGLVRAGYPPAARARIKEAFRILYRQGHTPARAVALLEALGTEEALRLARFVAGSQRGILSGRKR